VSPLAPLRLYRARRFQGRLELVGIDAGHRRARWRSYAYLTPIPKQLIFAGLEDVSGEYSEITVRTAGDDSATVELDAVGGTYAEIRVYEDAGIGGLGLHSLSAAAGAYTPIRVQAAAIEQPSKHSLSGTVPGEYKLVRQTAAVVETTTVQLKTVSGTYAP
jgi:hypothetical protein